MTETSGPPPQAPPSPQAPQQWGPPDPYAQGYSQQSGHQQSGHQRSGQPPYGPPQYGQSQYGPPPRTLGWATRPFLRSRDDRLIAGVAGGVGRSLGIDPLILRILLVVLAFFGGAGILLYALGWLLLDVDDGRGRSLVEDAFDARTPQRGRNLLTVAALAVAVFLSGLWVLSGQVVPVVLIVLTVVGLLLYARRDGQPLAGTGTPWAPPPPGQAYPGQPYPGQPYPGQPYQGQPGSPPPGAPPSDAPRSDSGTSTQGDTSMSNQPTVVLSGGTEPTAALYPATAGSTSSTWPAATQSTAAPPTFAAPPAGGPPFYGEPQGFTPPGGPPGLPPQVQPTRPPEPPRQRRERSYLGLLTISVALLALGVLAVQDVAYAAVPGSAYVVLPLAVVAAGLLVGTWVGRSRGLIVAGFLLSIALVPVVVVDAATDGDWSQIGDWSNAETRREAPTTAAAIQPSYDIGSGRLVLDLRGVEFSGADAQTTISVGAGEVLVYVPPDVDVVANGSVDIGDLVLFGERSSGLDSTRSIVQPGVDNGTGDLGELDITIDVNVGSAEVRR